MDKTQEKLEKETEKWLRRLEDKIDDIETDNEEFRNVLAYKEDTKHFLREEDYIRAWESVIYAWGILETLERMEELENN